MRRVATVLGLTAALLAAAAWLAAGASARFTTGLLDYKFLQSDRATWLDRAQAAGAQVIRLNVSWRQIVRCVGLTCPPKPLQPTNPADPAYNWRALDAAVQEARARGFKVLFTVYGAPNWAEGPNRPPHTDPDPVNDPVDDKYPIGSWRPNPADFAALGTALATRYSGHYAPPGGTVLPRVDRFEAWNEPNLWLYITPQYHHGHLVSPDIYRDLVNAFYSAVKAVQPGASVAAGTTAPYGDPAGGLRTHPITFLRGLLCLNKKLKPTHCGATTHLDAFSSHSITFPFFENGRSSHAGPTTPALNRNDVGVADFHKVRAVLRAAEKARHVKPRRHHALWATEFWWYSNPPNRRYGLPLRKQAKYIEQSLYLLWKQGASLAIYLGIGDGPYDPSRPLATQQTGLYFIDGRRKPALTAFRFPFVTYRAAHKRIAAWGKAPQAGKLKIQRRRHGHWRTLKRLHVHRGAVFTPKLGRHAKGHLRARVGSDTSLAWRQR